MRLLGFGRVLSVVPNPSVLTREAIAVPTVANHVGKYHRPCAPPFTGPKFHDPYRGLAGQCTVQ